MPHWHFLSSKTDIPVQDIHLFSGFKLLGEAVGNLPEPNILSAFFGLADGGAYFRNAQNAGKGQSGLCIGCHTMLVWQIKNEQTIV